MKLKDWRKNIIKDHPLKPGIINPATLAPFGFSNFFFEGWLWADIENKTIWISCISSLHPGQGNFRRLVEKILDTGYAVSIPTPLPQMQRIVEKNGYEKAIIFSQKIGYTTVWTLKPKADK